LKVVGGTVSDFSPVEMRVTVRRDTDVVVACEKGRALAARLGFSANDQVVIVIAISEMAHNIVRYAQRGEIVLKPAHQDGRCGIAVVARDDGPGIPDVERAMQDGYSTGGGLGLGLSGTKRLVDEFEIISQLGKGTVVTVKKWKR
jgi:serine/threonine-protein kinase RsbT